MSTLTKNIVLPKDAVGHKITTKIPKALTHEKVSSVRNLLNEKAQDYDSINYVYVITKQNTLKGVLSVKDIFKADPETKIADLVQEQHLVRVHPKTDQEKAARLAIKYNINAMPIVDEDDKLLGVLSGDQISSILDHEAREDLLRISGILSQEDELSVIQSFKGRVPWILFGLTGGLVTAKVIAGFENILAQNLILASFIPLVAYIANAVGAQTQTIYIRDLAVNKKITKFYPLKHITVSAMIALSCWVLLTLLTTIIWQNPNLGAVVGMAIALAIANATFFALLIPFVLYRLDTDPAIGSGPFATVIQDLLSVLIYFTVASAYL